MRRYTYWLEPSETTASHASSARAGRSRQCQSKRGGSTRKGTQDGAGNSAVLFSAKYRSWRANRPPFAIAELARLGAKAKSETAWIAAIRELLDRGYGRPRQAVEVSAPEGDAQRQETTGCDLRWMILIKNTS
jgi:hypothetical protein